MKKSDTMSLIILIIGGLTYSIVSFAYMHSTFPSKDMFELIVKKLDSIEQKIEKLYEPRSR